MEKTISLYCDNKYLKPGILKAPRMALRKFQKIFENKIDESENSLYNEINKQIESGFVIWAWDEPCSDKEKELLGYHRTKNGIPYIGLQWVVDDVYIEHIKPYYFIVYFDGERLRAYVPTCGNTFDIEYRTSFGYEDKSKVKNDFKVNYQKDFYKDFNKKFKQTIKNYGITDTRDLTSRNLVYDQEWIEKDIKVAFKFC